MKSLKIAAAAVGAICVLSLAGCNSGKNAGTGTTGNVATTPATTTEASTTTVLLTTANGIPDSAGITS